jgi:hypothetical protein
MVTIAGSKKAAGVPKFLKLSAHSFPAAVYHEDIEIEKLKYFTPIPVKPYGVSWPPLCYA